MIAVRVIVILTVVVCPNGSGAMEFVTVREGKTRLTVPAASAAERTPFCVANRADDAFGADNSAMASTTAKTEKTKSTATDVSLFSETAAVIMSTRGSREDILVLECQSVRS